MAVILNGGTSRGLPSLTNVDTRQGNLFQNLEKSMKELNESNGSMSCQLIDSPRIYLAGPMVAAKPVRMIKNLTKWKAI